MHFVFDSAKEGMRSRRKTETRTALIRRARRLTAQHGLAGYTIDEVSEQVGVSRRTFFNYFPSKEAAVLGTAPVDLIEEALAVFAYSPPAGDRLVDVLVEFSVQLFEASGMTREEVGDFIAAMDREPRLFADLVRGSEQEEARLAGAIAVREKMQPDDPAARMAAVLITTLVRRTAFDYFAADNTTSFAELAATNLLAARRVFSPAQLPSTQLPSTTKEPIDHHG